MKNLPSSVKLSSPAKTAACRMLKYLVLSNNTFKQTGDMRLSDCEGRRTGLEKN